MKADAQQKVFKFELDLSTLVVAVRIPYEPQQWERPGQNNGRQFDTKANVAAKEEIRRYIRLAKPGIKPDAQNRFGKIYLFATNLWTTDEDNYTKLVNDAVKGLVWGDDRQCDESYVRVVRGVNCKPHSQLFFYTRGFEL